MALTDHANSPQQRRIAKAIEEHPTWSYSQLASHLGLTKSVVSKTAHRLRLRQAQKEPGEHTHKAPPGYRLRGVSTLREDENGFQQWVKTERLPLSKDPTWFLKASEEAIRDAQLPISVPVHVPRSGTWDSDLLSVYPLGDPHLGLVASALTSARDYDLDTCVSDLLIGLQELVDGAPASEHALITNVGDFFHADTPAGVTARSGHKLSVDPRWHHVLKTGIEAMIRLVSMCLEKHRYVVVDNRPGNHDDMSAAFLQMVLAAYYKDEPRVQVVDDIHQLWWYEHGDVLIVTGHGHEPKADDIPAIIATDAPEVWGRTKTRHAYTGHIHHRTVKELRGCTVESLRVHGSPDQWTHAAGYRSKRSIIMDVWHKTRGHRKRLSYDLT